MQKANSNWLKAALIVSLGAQAAAIPPVNHPVVVHFGPLAWLRAQGAAPTIQQGRVLVPPAESCDLLGLACTLQAEQLKVGEQSVPLVRAAGTAALVPLTPLVALAGQQVTWNATSRTANVAGGTGSQGWRGLLGQLPANPAPFPAPLKSVWGAVQQGVPTIPLTVLADQPLSAFTLFSKTGNGLVRTGSLVQGSADVPNAFPGCQGKATCTLPAPRDALWVLAYLTR